MSRSRQSFRKCYEVELHVLMFMLIKRKLFIFFLKKRQLNVKPTSLKRGKKKQKQVNTTAILWILDAGTVQILRTFAHPGAEIEAVFARTLK